MSEDVLKQLGIEYERRADGTLFVAGDINLSSKRLTELPDLSKVHVEGHFYCNNNQLTSLAGAPQTVRGNFLCDNNQLTSLEGAPRGVGGFFWCQDNKLTSLEGVSVEFIGLRSDFGNFDSWGDIPEELRISSETRERLAREAFERKVQSGTVTQKPIKMLRRIKGGA